MSRDYQRLERGIHVTAENSDVGVKYLFGSGAPTLDAEVGSLYLRTDDATMWRKITAGTGADKWERCPVLADIAAITFRSEKVVALTATAAPVSGGTIDLGATPLSGDETPLLTGANFTPNVSHILFGYGGTEKLMKVSAVLGDVITLVDVADPLGAGDTFVVDNYLPDSPGAQEGMALVTYSNGDYVKIGDVNWNFADGINLTAGYTPGSGNVAPSDTVEVAIQKLDGVNDAQDATIGVSQGATNLGSFTGTTISDNVSVKTALQEIETYVEALDTLTKTKVTGITTVQTVDQVKTKLFQAAKWHVVAFLESNPSQKQAFEVYALHDGTTVADATVTDDTVYSKLKVGANFTVNINTDLSGVGANQFMRLRVDAPASVTITATRLEVDQ